MIYRQGRNYENLNKMIYRGTGKFDTPCLVPEVCNADSFIGFNYAKSCKDPQHIGTQMNATARALFLAGYKEMLKRLQPAQILFYGSIPAECSGDKIIPILTFQDGLKRRVSKKFTQDEGNSQEDVL